jgi:hypothetical protein
MLCAVHADLEDAFDASPSAVGKDGQRYRDVTVRLHLTYPLCMPSLISLTVRPMYVLWRNGAYGPSPLEHPCESLYALLLGPYLSTQSGSGVGVRRGDRDALDRMNLQLSTITKNVRLLYIYRVCHLFTCNFSLYVLWSRLGHVHVLELTLSSRRQAARSARPLS